MSSLRQRGQSKEKNCFRKKAANGGEKKGFLDVKEDDLGNQEGRWGAI